MQQVSPRTLAPKMPSPSLARSLSELSEFDCIRRIREAFGQTGRSVIKGIGDDAALLTPHPGQALLVTTDLLVEGIHFDLTLESFEDVGYRAAVANLSDIAAMGGTPQYLLVAIAIPGRHSQSELHALYRGVMEPCQQNGVELVGGDTSSSRQGIFLSITLIGRIEPKLAMGRDGAKAGDLIYVTGTLGDSLAGLKILHATAKARRGKGTGTQRNKMEQFLIYRHRRPTPRMQVGHLLAQYRLATAAIDISDGLSGDLAHICRESRVGVELEAEALPISEQCRAYATQHGVQSLHLALTGGEDYELLFTVSPRKRIKLERLIKGLGSQITRIGTIRPKQSGMCLKLENGTSHKLDTESYEHFQTGRKAKGKRQK